MAHRTNTPDLVEAQIINAYNGFSLDVDHYHELKKLAKTEHGQSKWAIRGRRAQKLKDYSLELLYTYQESRSLRVVAAKVAEQKEEINSLITWLKDRGEDARHIEAAGYDKQALDTILGDAIFTAKTRMAGTIQREAHALSRELKQSVTA
jgi:hypothetical protein